MNTRLRISRFFAAGAALVLAVACAVTSASAAGVATGQTRGDRATQMLFDAVHTNDFAAAEAAVAAGANVEARDRWNLSAVELAIDKGYFRIAHFLVSVRNSRPPADADVRQGRVQPSPAGAEEPVQADAAPAKPAAAAPRAKAVPQPQTVVAQPQWPADKPNPFDPAAPAFGTALPIIPTGASADAAATGDGPMLANDEAIRRGEAVR